MSHTPTTKEVKGKYVNNTRLHFEVRRLDPAAFGSGESEYPAEFDRWLEQHDAKVAKATEERIIKLLKKEIVNNAVWRAQNRMWSNDWNGGQDTDVEYLISMATSLIALIKGETK